VSASTTRTWNALLLRAPDATLLVSGVAYQDADTFAELVSRFDPKVRERIRLRPWARSDAEVHERHADVDVILDTFPYQGTTTTCDAFAAGRPVVALRWPTPAGRVASSLLAAAGIPDLVATTADGYVETALALAEDAQRLRELDEALPAALRDGPLGDPDGLAQSFLRAFAVATAEASSKEES
jgi:protein O-GlcNAc transferase